VQANRHTVASNNVVTPDSTVLASLVLQGVATRCRACIVQGIIVPADPTATSRVLCCMLQATAAGRRVNPLLDPNRLIMQLCGNNIRTTF
jgi:hypothetical protein